jgi:hypothetical protein
VTKVTPLCNGMSQFTAILLRVPYVFASSFSPPSGPVMD